MWSKKMVIVFKLKMRTKICYNNWTVAWGMKFMRAVLN